MKTYVLPEGMRKAATEAFNGSARCGIHDESLQFALIAALRWLSENPIVPTPEQAEAIWKGDVKWYWNFWEPVQQITESWQRKMFLAPEPEVPEEIGDLRKKMEAYVGSPNYPNELLLEAYRRGKAAK